MSPAGDRFAVYQDSSGGANWQSSNHVNREGHVPTSFRGYRALVDAKEVAGLRDASRLVEHRRFANYDRRAYLLGGFSERL